MVKKFWEYVYSFRHNTRTWRTDGRTDRQIPYDGNGRACSLAGLQRAAKKIVVRSLHGSTPAVWHATASGILVANERRGDSMLGPGGGHGHRPQMLNRPQIFETWLDDKGILINMNSPPPKKYSSLATPGLQVPCAFYIRVSGHVSRPSQTTT